MAIVYNEQKQTFSLHTARTTYQLKIGNLNYVNHLYYGATIRDEDLSYLIRRYDRGFSGNPYDSLQERTFSLDAQPQEFTTQQQGDFRINSIEVQNSDGSFSFDGRICLTESMMALSRWTAFRPPSRTNRIRSRPWSLPSGTPLQKSG